MSAIVIRVVSSGDEIVGYKCDVVDKKNIETTLRCVKHNGFLQEAMPKIHFDIKIQDKVIISPLGKRAVIIAPTQNVYLQTKKKLKGYEFISSDLLASPLFSEDNPFPEREDFTKLCKRYLIGSLIFGFEKQTAIVDCGTFTQIKEIPNNFSIDKKDIIKPFFHRLEKIETGFWHWFGSEDIEDFDTYYKELLNDK
jgi:hypothetical protein